MGALLAVVCGLGLGLAAGGDVRALSELRLRGEMALVAAFLVQAVARGRVAGAAATIWGPPVWVAASLALVGLMALNAHRPGMLLGAAGVVLNLDVVLANSFMPVVPPIGAQSAAAAAAVASRGFYRVASPGALGLWSADVLLLRLFGQSYLLSVGDLLLGVGVVVLLASSLLGFSVQSGEGLRA